MGKRYKTSETTCQAISGALKQLMTQKPLERITVAEIMDTCGMRRQHFYYYFTDIYDLLRWTFEKEALELLQQQQGVSPWQNGFLHLFQYINQNRAVCLCALDSLGKESLKQMLEADPDARYADILEREIYNGTISGMQLDGTKFFYINQLEANPGMPTNAYGEEEYTPERIGWDDCACCPPNLARLMTSLGSYVWSSSEDTIYSHLFVGGTASFETAGGVKIALTSKYPWNGSVTYTVEPEQAGAEFTLAVRYPGWCHQMQVKVNGIPVSGAVKTDKGYWMIQRSWQPGDTVSCEMEMEPERVYAHPMVRADAGCVALRRGPIIYTFEGVDNGEDLQTLRIPREAKIEALPYQADLLEGIVALRVTGCRKKTAVNPALYAEDAAPEEMVILQAIPYYAWCNRGMTHMRVWMQE